MDVAWHDLTLSYDNTRLKKPKTYSMLISIRNCHWWKWHISFACALPLLSWFPLLIQYVQRIVFKVSSILWIIYECKGTESENFNEIFFFSKTMCAQIGRYSSLNDAIVICICMTLKFWKVRLVYLMVLIVKIENKTCIGTCITHWHRKTFSCNHTYLHRMCIVQTQIEYSIYTTFIVA